MDLAASIIPLSTSTREFSTCLEKNGTVPHTRGTIAAVGPIVVPTKNLVNDATRAMIMTNGIDLVILTSLSRTEYIFLFSSIPPFPVTTRATPIANPKMPAIRAVTRVI